MDHNLKDVLMPLAILGTFGGSLILFSKTLLDYRLKKNMIDKGFVNEDTQAIFKKQTSDDKFSALKWGLIIFFAGLSLIVIEYVPSGPESPLPYGVFALFVSLGFLVYYYLVKKELNK